MNQRMVIKHLSPEVFPSRSLFRFYLVTEYLFIFCLLAHLLLLMLFLGLGVYPMAMFNGLSLAVFSFCLFLTKRGYHYSAFFLGTTEIIVHSFLSALFLGLGPGFHLFILTLGPCMFLLPFTSDLGKWLLMLGTIIAFTALRFFFADYSAPYVLSIDLENLFFTINIIVVVFSLSLLSYYFSRASWAAETYISHLSQVDPLTGCLNRRGMEEVLANERVHNSISNASLGLLMCDIDDFKKVNDSYGHSFGDQVLKETVLRMGTALRLTDQIGRWGGEEFLIMLPGTDINGAERAADKVLKGITESPYEIEGKSLYLSITIGVSVLNNTETLQNCIKRADKAMYTGKLGGKNRVVARNR
ncbi:GGDEF domain-containing protein [Marispirochaeta aestuarii]|uniref:GGDEF domain-containing protein n=1 Tax=Marispirochaeta aestuarii TaxID=1963862 RepID=UPI0029C8CED7|nr:GGDEF domain-containing protein [Marispirochaeta aestuarii]